METDPTFNPGTPTLAFDASGYNNFGAREYDLAPDGERFLMRKVEGVQAVSDDAFTGMIVVQNWFEELRACVPVP